MPASGPLDSELEGALIRSWTHAHESDAPGRIVFRPSEEELPPSRGRRTIDLRPGLDLRLVDPGPDDRPVEHVGTWSLDGTVLSLEVEGRGPERFEVEAVDEHELVLREL